jgi:hypothetical protein
MDDKRLLIIRSASFQQLDSNLLVIRKKFPDSEIHLLTHQHGSKLSEKFLEVKFIHIYPYKESFHSKRRAPEVEKIYFDDVVILVSNVTGAGFANVFDFSKQINARHLHICNLRSDIDQLSPADIQRIHFKDTLNKTVGYILGIPLGLLCVAWFFTTCLVNHLVKSIYCYRK